MLTSSRNSFANFAYTRITHENRKTDIWTDGHCVSALFASAASPCNLYMNQGQITSNVVLSSSCVQISKVHARGTIASCLLARAQSLVFFFLFFFSFFWKTKECCSLPTTVTTFLTLVSSFSQFFRHTISKFSRKWGKKRVKAKKNNVK